MRPGDLVRVRMRERIYYITDEGEAWRSSRFVSTGDLMVYLGGVDETTCEVHHPTLGVGRFYAPALQEVTDETGRPS